MPALNHGTSPLQSLLRHLVFICHWWALVPEEAVAVRGTDLHTACVVLSNSLRTVSKRPTHVLLSGAHAACVARTGNSKHV